MGKGLVSWSDTFSIGLDEIDDQHKSLFDLINQIWDAIVARSEPQSVFALLDELEKYTVAHFAAEETFMRVTNYPNFDRHKEQHAIFVNRVAEEKKRAIAAGVLSIDLLHFLKDWLVQHILVLDKDYANFTRQGHNEKQSMVKRFFKRFF